MLSREEGVDGLNGGRSPQPKPSHRHAVIFSYQSTQTPFLFRVRRVLRQCGLTTVDGTMVPPGMDWRSFYFSMMEKAFSLVIILSPELLRSAACFEELTMARKLGLPVVPIFYTPQAEIEACITYPSHEAVAAAIEQKLPQAELIPSSWRKMTMQGAGLDPTRQQVYQELVTSISDLSGESAPGFETDFWGHMVGLATQCGRHVPEDTSFHIAFCCANIPKQAP